MREILIAIVAIALVLSASIAWPKSIPTRECRVIGAVSYCTAPGQPLTVCAIVSDRQVCI